MNMRFLEDLFMDKYYLYCYNGSRVRFLGLRGMPRVGLFERANERTYYPKPRIEGMGNKCYCGEYSEAR